MDIVTKISNVKNINLLQWTAESSCIKGGQRYPADKSLFNRKCSQNVVRYPPDRDSSNGYHHPRFKPPRPGVK